MKLVFKCNILCTLLKEVVLHLFANIFYSQLKFALVGYVNTGGEGEMTIISQTIETKIHHYLFIITTCASKMFIVYHSLKFQETIQC